jgi:uncharacterized protein YqeY
VKDRITEDMKRAMRERDGLATETFRMLLSAIKNEEIARRRPLNDEETAAILSRAVKTRLEAIELYEKGGRPELAEKERKEIELVRRYLPQPLSHDETATAIDELIRELGATSKKDVGRLMKALMARYPGRVDGRLANQIAASHLT